MKRILRTLYWKVSLALLGLLLFLGVVVFFLYSYLFNATTDSSEQLVNWGLAERLSTRFVDSFHKAGNFWDLQQTAHEFSVVNPNLGMYLLNGDGSIEVDFAEQEDGTRREVVEMNPVRLFLAGEKGAELPIYGDNPAFRSRTSIFSAAPITLGSWSGYLYVVLRNSQGVKLRTVYGENDTVRGSALTLFFSVGLTGLIGLVLFYFMTRRFFLVTEAVQQFERGDFRTRVDVKGNDEIDALARAVNQMADTIESNIEALKNRDQLRRDLIANVSHDLRGPVAVINGYMENLLRRKVDISSEELEKQHEIVFKNSQGLSKLLDELFQLAKLEANEAHPYEEAFSLTQVVADLVGSFQPLAQQLEITLGEAGDENVPLVAADIAMIERVLSNLIENALRYTPAGGAVEVRLTTRPDDVLVEIIDNGVGIPQESLEHVFDRFHRVEQASPRAGTSTGLGLAIVKKIIQAHGREIQLRSEVGKGTTFYFSLRRA